MKRVLADIQQGKFARDWVLENKAGQSSFKATRALGDAHQIEEVGAKLRAMMPWIAKNKLVDTAKNCIVLFPTGKRISIKQARRSCRALLLLGEACHDRTPADSRSALYRRLSVRRGALCRLEARPLTMNACHCDACKKMSGGTNLLMLHRAARRLHAICGEVHALPPHSRLRARRATWCAAPHAARGCGTNRRPFPS